jgi:hypothetical protein
MNPIWNQIQSMGVSQDSSIEPSPEPGIIEEEEIQPPGFL